MLLRVREIGDSSEDGTLCPVPSGNPSGLPFELEEGDGGLDRVRSVPVKNVGEYEMLPGGARPLVTLTGIDGRAYITDARLVVVVRNYDKGKVYVGHSGVGALVAMTASGISAARAAQRRKGKILIGQVRWQWALVLGAQPKKPMNLVKRRGVLRAIVQAKEGAAIRSYRLDMGVPGTVPAQEAARDLVQRAASWRLAHFPGPEDDLERLRELASAPVLPPPARGRMAIYAMPGRYYVSRDTAYPAQAGDGAAQPPAGGDGDSPAAP
jgi:hypothetical protein